MSWLVRAFTARFGLASENWTNEELVEFILEALEDHRISEEEREDRLTFDALKRKYHW